LLYSFIIFDNFKKSVIDVRMCVKSMCVVVLVG